MSLASILQRKLCAKKTINNEFSPKPNGLAWPSSRVLASRSEGLEFETSWAPVYSAVNEYQLCWEVEPVHEGIGHPSALGRSPYWVKTGPLWHALYRHITGFVNFLLLWGRCPKSDEPEGDPKRDEPEGDPK